MTTETSVAPTEMYLVVGKNSAATIDLTPLQGTWTPEQYLAISGATNNLIEFTDGMIEVLPMPTRNHQAIALFMLLRFLEFIRPLGGVVFFAPLRLAIRPGAFREPDLLLLRDANDPRNQNAYWLGADLVLEVVSPDDPDRDLVVKPRDYAAAQIPEYWIVNPLDETITVLQLVDRVYVQHGVFRRSERATSALLADFSVAVDDVLNAA
jgi:Uma2 family endonuclease